MLANCQCASMPGETTIVGDSRGKPTQAGSEFIGGGRLVEVAQESVPGVRIFRGAFDQAAEDGQTVRGPAVLEISPSQGDGRVLIVGMLFDERIEDADDFIGVDRLDILPEQFEEQLGAVVRVRFLLE